MVIKKVLLCLLLVVLGLAYDPTLGENLCRLTVASYCNHKKVADWTCLPCSNSPIKLTNVQVFYNSTGDSLGFIGISQNPKSIFLVFRGTLPWDMKNWISDINFLKIPYARCDNHCEVHRGFYYAYMEISIQVKNAVIDYQRKFKITDLIVTGHSLGGALATHAVAHLITQGIKITATYTYGSPRVGDSKFTTWLQGQISSISQARVTHGRDPVPHLPPYDFGFIHVPHQIFYESSKQKGYVTCTDSSLKEDIKCSDKFLQDVMVTDHLSYYGIDFSGIILACQ